MKGFALLEVLVALLILSIGLLGILGLQLSTLKKTQNSYFYSVATTQISSLFESLYANKIDASRSKELAIWQTQNAQLLPQGSGQYRCDQKDNCTVDVQWMSTQTQHLSITNVP